jgi:hypothetical protein
MICDRVQLRCEKEGRVSDDSIAEIVRDILRERGRAAKGDVVEYRGIFTCRVVDVSPDDDGWCAFFASATKLTVAAAARFQVREEEGGVVVKLDGETYVYDPSVWIKIYKSVVEPLKEGRPPLSAGFRLVGLPGVGKTTLASLAAALSGAMFMSIDAGSILSKWVGESEKRLKRALEEAASTSNPVVVALNDFDTLLVPEGASGSSVSEVYSNLRHELVNWIDRVHDSPKVVLATSNMSAADPALERRLPAIFVPPPTVEQVKMWLEQSQSDVLRRAYEALGREQVAAFAVREAQRGASWGHIIRALKMSIATGKLESIFRFNAPGYAMLSPLSEVPPVPAGVADRIRGMLGPDPSFKAVPAVVGASEVPVSEYKYSALAKALAYIVARAYRRHVVVLVESAYTRDALAVAEQLGGFLLAPGTLRGDPLRVVLESSVPVLFDHMPQEVRLPPLILAQDYAVVRDYLTEVIIKFYGIPCANAKALVKPSTVRDMVDFAWAASKLRVSCEQLAAAAAFR